MSQAIPNQLPTLTLQNPSESKKDRSLYLRTPLPISDLALRGYDSTDGGQGGDVRMQVGPRWVLGMHSHSISNDGGGFGGADGLAGGGY